MGGFMEYPVKEDFRGFYNFGREIENCRRDVETTETKKAVAIRENTRTFGGRADGAPCGEMEGKTLVVAEKPSVARALAEVLGAREKKDGYLDGEHYAVTWCIGHLVEPLDPEGYDESYKKWSYQDLPIIPKEWRYRAKKETKKQYDIVASLLNNRRISAPFSQVVCATDAGREGETIFRKVYQLSGSRLPIKRLWISSMEESAIREGFANLRPGSEYEKGYMQYIADHDNYRCADPLFKSQKRMFGKTKKERRRLKKRERKIKRWQGIRYVNRLFDMVASGVAVL